MTQENKSNLVSEVLYRLNVNSKLDLKLLESAFDKLLSDEETNARDTQLGSLLTGIMIKGPTVNEVVTLLESAFKLDGFSPYKKKKVELPNQEKLIGAIGSGKKGYKTMNISTPSLIVASTMDVYTAKPVSSSTSSLTGSADLLTKLGMNINLSTNEMIEVIKKTRFGAFCIENIIPKFDRVYGKRFYVPHALSFGLAALVSPIQLDNFIYGLAHPDIETSIQVLQKFGIDNVMVVSTTHDNIHYIDEIGIYGTTKLIGMKDGNIGKLIYFSPREELGLPRYTPEDIIQANTPEQNIKFCVDLLRGNGEQPREDLICINAGAILYLAEKSENLREGYFMAKGITKQGKPLEKLLEIVEYSGGDPKTTIKYIG